MIRSKPKPEQQWKGGRLILSGSLYTRMKHELWTLADGKCEKCGTFGGIAHGDPHHIIGRGGGKRDDRIFIDGERNLEWLCRRCHDRKHRPDKVVPAKPKYSEEEFKQLMGIE